MIPAFVVHVHVVDGFRFFFHVVKTISVGKELTLSNDVLNVI